MQLKLVVDPEWLKSRGAAGYDKTNFTIYPHTEASLGQDIKLNVRME